MARPIRIELAGGVYHVTSRGDRREDIYADDRDRRLWLNIFRETCQRFNWSCHAWCLMGNHYHVLIETIDANLSKGMRHLNGVFTQATNRRHHRTGHLFQGRFKAILVEKESHLLELNRYVVLNPVRAQMVENVSQWPWSSWHEMTSTSKQFKWIQTDWTLSQFGASRSEAIESYKRFVQEGMTAESPWERLSGQIFLGPENFVKQAQVIAAKESLTEIPRAQRRTQSFTLSDFEIAASSPKIAMARAYASGDFTMREIAHYFDVHYSSVSRAVRMYSVD